MLTTRSRVTDNSRVQRISVPRQLLEQTSQLQLKKHLTDLLGRKAGAAHDVVHLQRGGPREFAVSRAPRRQAEVGKRRHPSRPRRPEPHRAPAPPATSIAPQSPRSRRSRPPPAWLPGGSAGVGPRLRLARAGPGTANTSRPCSSAQRAVIREPLRSVASTTTTPRARPLMRRLRDGKWCDSGRVPNGCSESTAPPPSMRRLRSRCSGG